MKGKTVAILEARLGKQLSELVAQRGGRVVHAPALAEVRVADPQAIAAMVNEIRARPAALAVFQTGVGTSALFDALDALGLTSDFLALLDRMKVAVRGPKPAAALRGRGVRMDIETAEPYTTNELLHALAGTRLDGERVLVQRYGAANVELEEALRARGAEVIEITTYRWSLPADTKPLIRLIGKLELGSVDAVAVTNAAQVYNLFALAERRGRSTKLRDALNRTLVASIGPVASAALRRFGVRVRVEASPPKLGPFLAALEQALSREARAR